MQIVNKAPGVNTRRRRVRFSYPANFKNDVLSSLKISSPRITAKSLGIPLSTLYRWRKNLGRQGDECKREQFCLPSTSATLAPVQATCKVDSPRALAGSLDKPRHYRFDRSVARHSRQVLERLMLASEFIEERYFERVDCHALASIAGMSKCHFVRIYKQAMGQSPYQHLIQRRASAALDLLGVTLQPTLAIACAVGFESTSSLIKALKKFSATGIPELIY